MSDARHQLLAQLSVAPLVIERVLNHVSGICAGVIRRYNRLQFVYEMRSVLELWAEHVGRRLEPA